MCKEEGPERPFSHTLACWVVLSCGSQEARHRLGGCGVQNEDDAGTYFKGKYRVEGVTMKWVRVLI